MTKKELVKKIDEAYARLQNPHADKEQAENELKFWAQRFIAIVTAERKDRDHD